MNKCGIEDDGGDHPGHCPATWAPTDPGGSAQCSLHAGTQHKSIAAAPSPAADLLLEMTEGT